MIKTELRLPDDIHELLRQIAFNNRISMNKLILKYIEKGLKDETK